MSRLHEVEQDSFLKSSATATHPRLRSENETQTQAHAASVQTSLSSAGTLDQSQIWLHDNESLRNTWDSIVTFVGLFSIDGIVLEANKAPLDMGGLRREDVIGKALWDTYWFSHSSEARGRVQIALERAGLGETVRYDEVIRAAGDQRITIDITLNPVRDKSGKILQIVGSAIDVTERKESEEALRFGEERLRLATEGSNTGLWDWDLCADKIYFSPVWKRQIGYEIDEIPNLFEEWQDRVHPEDVSATLEKIKEYLENAEPNFEDEFRLRHKDGSYRWMLSKGVLVTDSHGRPARMLGVNVDITDRKRVGEALREKTYMLSESQRIAQVGTWSWEISTGNVQWSDESYRLYGRTRDSFVPSAESYLEPIHPEDRATVQGWLRSYVLNEQHPDDTEFRALLPDGTVRILRGQGELQRSEDGSPFRMVGTIQDISERKRATEKLTASESRFRTLFEQAADGIFVSDADGRYVEVNSAGAKMLGYATDEFHRLTITDILAPEEFPRLQAIMVRLAHGESVRRELRILRRDGSQFEGEVIAKRLPNGHYQAFLRDATERNQIAESLRRTSHQLRALASRLQEVREEERTRVARDLHDDIGQILTAVKMDLAWLGRRLPEEQNEIQERIQSATDLISDGVRSVRKICAGLRPEVLDDLGLAAAIEWQANDFATRVGIPCQISVPHADLDLESEQATAIFRIFQEALTNIARHAGASSVSIYLKQQAGDVVLVVKDDGTGFLETQSSKSLGVLGMKERAQACGGEVQLTSWPNEGTTVTVTIPLHIHMKEVSNNAHPDRR